MALLCASMHKFFLSSIWNESEHINTLPGILTENADEFHSNEDIIEAVGEIISSSCRGVSNAQVNDLCKGVLCLLHSEGLVFQIFIPQYSETVSITATICMYIQLKPFIAIKLMVLFLILELLDLPTLF